jgi:CRP/FNR family transcriptional regulator
MPLLRAGSVSQFANNRVNFRPDVDDVVTRQAAVSTALVTVFRGKFCDTLLQGRKAITFNKGDVIFNIGDRDRVFFFLQSGFVKVGAITPNGREVIYDVRTGGDVIGELCASEEERLDRAVTLEQTEAIPVRFEEIMSLIISKPDLTRTLIGVFCSALKEAYAQVNALASDDMIRRLARVLLNLAAKFGQRADGYAEMPIYLTQEEIAQMVVARRERISTALNFLRREKLVEYTARGQFMIHVSRLEQVIAN